jgi:transcriptional regulator with XRE-family HTH domain
MDYQRVKYRRRVLSASSAAAEEQTIYLRDLGHRMKLVRTRKMKLSVEAMAKLLGVSAMAVSKWENGKTLITDQNLTKFARATGVSETWLKSAAGIPERGHELFDLLGMLTPETQDQFFDNLEFLINRHFERQRKE